MSTPAVSVAVVEGVSVVIGVKSVRAPSDRLRPREVGRKSERETISENFPQSLGIVYLSRRKYSIKHNYASIKLHLDQFIELMRNRNPYGCCYRNTRGLHCIRCDACPIADRVRQQCCSLEVRHVDYVVSSGQHNKFATYVQGCSSIKQYLPAYGEVLAGLLGTNTFL